MNTLYRAQILLEPDQHEALAEIAEIEGRSISSLVREIVRHHLADREQQARRQGALQALERLTQIRTMVQEDRGIYPGDPLAGVRAERARDVERVWSQGE